MTSEALQNPYFVSLYCIYILTKHIFTYNIVKIGPHFLFLENGGNKMEIRKCLDDF